MRAAPALLALFAGASLVLGATTITPVDTPPVAIVIPAGGSVTISPIVVDLLAVLVSPVPTPAQISALVAQLSVADLANVAITLANNPAALSELASALTVSQSAQVLAALASEPSALAAVAAEMDPAKLAQAKVALFLTDIDGWQRVDSFLNPPAAAPGARKHFGGNWLDAARTTLAAKIQRDGYTPELLSEAGALMQKAQASHR